jgi:hypothetical protein
VFAWTEKNREKSVRILGVYDPSFGSEGVKTMHPSKVYEWMQEFGERNIAGGLLVDQQL